MKIALITANNYWFAPYVKIYEEILNEQSIDYDIISWDRDGTNDKNVISFHLMQSLRTNKLNKYLGYLMYRMFVVKTLSNNNYDKLVVFGPKMGLLLFEYLKKNYRKNFVLDYRDLSLDQIFKKRFKKVLDCSAMVAISSPGFKRALPVGYDYLISHNISSANLFKKINCPPPFNNQKIKISTIGAIRDIDANMELVQSLENQKNITIQFIGKGSEVIEKLSPNIDNVECKGYYEKKNELELTLDSDFINIFMPADKNSTILLSNRLYNALICKRPMIVKSNSIQGDFVEKYGLGISIENCTNLSQKIQDYVSRFDFNDFSNNCDLLLKEFIGDYNHFKNELLNLLHSR